MWRIRDLKFKQLGLEKTQMEVCLLISFAAP